jgi:transcriptional regulator with XRE-family HTH domain
MKYSEYQKKLKENQEFVEASEELKLHFGLADAVLKARMAKGLTQAQVAEAVGTKQANISRIEAGLGNPTLALVQKLTALLEIEVQFAVHVNKKTAKALEEARDHKNLKSFDNAEVFFKDLGI